MQVKDIIVENPDFQTSINIGYDFGSLGRIKGLIPTDLVCKYLSNLVSPVLNEKERRAKVLVGPYGTGKSHIALTALSSMWIKDADIYRGLIEAYSERGWEFGKEFSHFVSDGARLLPVVVSGSSSDLRRSLLIALRNALSDVGLEELMPRTNFSGALEVLRRWESQYPETLKRFEELTGVGYLNFVERLSNLDSAAYDEFLEVYPELTSGSQYDSLSDSDVVELYESVLEKIEKHGISGIYVVYDEFSKYLETSIAESSIEDIKLLQDFAELCNRSGSSKQLHLLLISHKSLENYIDSRLPKEKVDGWRGVSGRFLEVVIENDPDQSYELISHAIKKDEKLWTQWLDQDNCRIERALSEIKEKYSRTGLTPTRYSDMIVFGCYPLHPVSAFLLPRISNKVAQNERTLFTYLCSNEDCSLSQQLEACSFLVSPDCIYDYFAPLMRKEAYATEVHRVYELANIALNGVDEGSLEAKIIKMVALTSAVGSYDTAAPTKSFIFETYEECGYSKTAIDSALASLIDSSSLVYLRQSNSYLKLKEASGVRIDSEISDRIESLRDKITPVQALNGFNLVKAHYPSRHNETHATVRYFDSSFTRLSDLKSHIGDTPVWDDHPDGEILAILPESADDLKKAQKTAAQFTLANPMSIVIVPKKFKQIEDALYHLAAAMQLKEEAGEDRVLAEEYEIVIEDYSEIVNAYINSIFNPELKESQYYALGKEKRSVSRRRRLSDLMSDLCDAVFPNTPIITSEALNRNRLTGTAHHSRARVLNGLCAQNIEPNLGFVGNGQETSMMRSALERTGVIPDCSAPHVNLAPESPQMRLVIETIQDFMLSAQNTPFSVLYEKLQSSELGIGMKRGPIPLYLAIVLSPHRDEIKITSADQERQLSPETLEDIDSHPDQYYLSQLNWSDEMHEYTKSLNTIFGLNSNASRTQLVDAMKQWFVTMPQFTRNSKVNSGDIEINIDIWRHHIDFMQLMRREVLDTQAFLFEELPATFGRISADSDLTVAILREKRICDEYIDGVYARLKKELVELLIGEAPAETSLDSAVKDWLETLSDAAKGHVFNGMTNQVFIALRNSTPDDKYTISRIAKAATSLRIQDWNDLRYSDFIESVRLAISDVAAFDLGASSQPSQQAVNLSFRDESGDLTTISFGQTDCSKRASLLKSSILSNIDDMGQSITPEEKRQVVFEVLKELC